jgi:beta-galactosidase
MKALDASITVCVVALLLITPACAWGDRGEVDLSGPGWRLLDDKDASWEHDTLYLPPVDLSKLPTNPPTQGWASLTDEAGLPVSVPATAEEYLGDGSGPSTDVKGVTWWYRQVEVPANKSQRVTLQFESARQRAEIYVDGKLVGYDIIGNTPFEVDLTSLGLAGKTVQLAVRITDPGGNFDWIDYYPQLEWGKYKLPMSHGFGGITGRVKLIMSEDVYCSDLYVQNTPAIHDVNMLVTVQNAGSSTVRRNLKVDVLDGEAVVATRTLTNQELNPGETTLNVPISAPGATLWDLDNPKLYTARVTLQDGDSVTDHVQKRFGFRWFTVDGIGRDAVFRLNGKRVFLTTAISWGFWPTNGMYATPEMAEKQIRTAKSLGMNMLNFHRCIGSPVVLEKADELGLLYFEEPGGYVTGGRDAFAQAISSEKLLRMVKRDRSHPSLIIYNMINEQWNQFGADKDDSLFAIHREDLRKAHELDPSRIIAYTSAWSDAGREQPVKLHMRPFDDRPYYIGWYDSHRAMGPETWLQRDYANPTRHVGYETDTAEIVYRGEEGAISSPPRLEKIHAALQKLPRPGWDGAVYERWYDDFAAFLDRKQLRGTFPSVDAFTCALGEVSLENQGRRIQAHRISTVVDGYAVNGWEAEVIENHSGIVDCFRNPKANPSVMARYLRPLYVAVMPRSQVLQAGSPLLVDFYVVNEKDAKGSHTLKVAATDAQGKQVFSKDARVELAGGETFGQLLLNGVEVPSTGAAGMWTISATLVDDNGNTIASGDDKILIVDWKSDRIPGNGAVYESDGKVRNFLSKNKGVDVPAYRDDLGKLDWLIVARPLNSDPELIPTTALSSGAGKAQGLTATFFAGQDFRREALQRTDLQVDLDVSPGATPDPNFGMTENYSVRWQGSIVPPRTGQYVFVAGGDDGVRLWVDGKQVIDDWSIHAYREQKSLPIQLEEDQPVKLKLEFFQGGGEAKCALKWSVPAADPPDPEAMIERAVNDGTTILFMDQPETWLDLIQRHSNVRASGAFDVGVNWLGGQFFVKRHPLLVGLPVDCAMNWPYQRVVRVGATRAGMRLEGEELVAGVYQSWPMSLGTAIGVIPCGKGRVVVSTLDICGALDDSDSTAEVARKMLCNYIRFSSAMGDE